MTIYDRLRQRVELMVDEIVRVDNQVWPMCRYGAMVPELMSEDGTWAAYAESGPAKGNIVWETEAVPIAILLPGEIVIKQTLMQALIEDNQRLREALRKVMAWEGRPIPPSIIGSSAEALMASDKALEEVLG